MTDSTKIAIGLILAFMSSLVVGFCIGQVYPRPAKTMTLEIQGGCAAFTSNHNNPGDSICVIVDGDTLLKGVFVDDNWVDKTKKK